MTPPENREGRDADKTAVITKPTPQSADESADNAGSPAASGSSGGNGQDTSAKDRTRPVSAETGSTAQAADTAAEKTAVVQAPDSEPVAAVTEEPIVTAPPPWQRVTNDTESTQDAYVAPGAPPVPSSSEPAPAFPQTDPDTVKVQKPSVEGSAVPVGLGSSRTSVNLGTGGARPAAATPSARRPGRGPRRASLQVKRVDPWSVLKLALVLGVALFFVWLVAVGVLYGVLHGMGVWDKINSTANDLLQANEPGEPLISAGRVFGVSAIIGAVNIVLFTALATVGAFVYNVSADLAGGLELTLSERE
ncbi:DUF3566 domain-containing protein [Nocardia sp. NRRL S-836]|uniref:DUF3566 domain-containing protein n=1 Tax=Nocardia sp. NRRL S-836 TaxID=1519492 RepID=UPI0007C68F46|nr:DUF3566 domain-containing protein [Nocardia sp. NRRL S-836]